MGGKRKDRENADTWLQQRISRVIRYCEGVNHATPQEIREELLAKVLEAQEELFDSGYFSAKQLAAIDKLVAALFMMTTCGHVSGETPIRRQEG